MKISLICPYATISAYGLRTISSCLKRDGHDVNLIFLPQKNTVRYTSKVLDELVTIIRESSLIGVSLMTNYFENAVQITQRIKQTTEAPVVWGGIHPTIRPEECLDHADIVCLGEAEMTISELTVKMQNGIDGFDTQGLWFKKENKIIKNELRPLIRNLDDIPYPDYDYPTHYVLSDHGIRIMDENLMKRHMSNDYLAHPTRGCPFGCSYCCNNTINKMYPEQKAVIRKRSIQNIIGELKDVRKNFPFVNHITFDDDAFFSYSEEDIEAFSKQYKQTIGLQLEIRGAHPEFITRPKMSLLVDAGLTGVRMGIQTGSERTKKLYKRHYSNKEVGDCVRIIHALKHKIPLPRYDIIVNNPWETDEDLTETLILFAEFPKPYLLNMFSLTFYPGTELYDKAVNDNLITDDLNDVYRKSVNLRTAGTSGKLLNEFYFNNLFFLLYVYSMNGYDIPTPIWLMLAHRKNHPVRSRMLYFALKLGASFLLKKQLIRDIYLSKKDGNIKRNEYPLD